MSRILTVLLALYILNCVEAGTHTNDTEYNIIVTTPNGQINGTLEKDENGEKLYYSFLRIPYAQPPVGDLRFEDPEPVEKWDDVIQAIEDLPKCAQVTITEQILGDEDCLYLNVFTPQISTTKESDSLKPVMVFIHGGAFTEGSGSKEWYSPDFLLREDVVLVTINYRLGIFGFFSLKNETTEITTGNAGLKDQVMALKWVKHNIDAFGGNPKNVTIFGESAGAASVHYHVLSEKSKGLFTKAIMQSGTALAPWVNGLENNGEALAKLLNKETTDHQKMLEELRKMEYDKILKGQIQLEKEQNQIWGSPINPIIESSHTTAFLSQTPYEIIKSGTYNNVTMIIGYNDAEGIAMDQKMRFLYGESKLINDFQELIPFDLEIKVNSSIAKNLAKDIKNFYYNGSEPSIKCMDPYIKIYRDAWFAYPAYRTAMAHAKNSSVYFYRFSADTDLNVYKGRDEISKTYDGASHCDELGYLFMTDVTPLNLTVSDESDEFNAMKRMVKLWTSFAKDGKPATDNLEWTLISPNSLNYLDFTTTKVEIKTNPDKDSMEFWTKQYDKYFHSYAICLKASPTVVFMYVLVKLIY